MSKDNLEYRIGKALFSAVGDLDKYEPPQQATWIKLGIEFVKLKHKIDEGREEGSALDEALREIESQEE